MKEDRLERLPLLVTTSANVITSSSQLTAGPAGNIEDIWHLALAHPDLEELGYLRRPHDFAPGNDTFDRSEFIFLIKITN